MNQKKVNLFQYNTRIRSMKYSYGDILWVKVKTRKKEQLKHPAIVWQEEFDGNGDFYGIMITHAPPKPGYENILMKKEHFEDGQEVGFDNSHFVNQIFQKFGKWGPFYKAGKLTKSGTEYINDNLTNLNLIEFEDYIRK